MSQTARILAFPLATALLVLSLGLAPMAAFAQYDHRHAATAVALYLGVGLLVALGWSRGKSGADRFGPANAVTILRVVMVCWIAGAIGQTGNDRGDWLIVGFGSAALVLDGVDGWLARRFNCASAFGERFDREVDALLILVLTILAFATGKAGLWVVAAGGLRYAFIAAARVLPGLAAPLPPGKRRQIVCVAVLMALIVILAPVVTPPVSTAIAAAAVAALALSFAIDTVLLLRNDGPPTASQPAPEER